MKCWHSIEVVQIGVQSKTVEKNVGSASGEDPRGNNSSPVRRKHVSQSPLEPCPTYESTLSGAQAEIEIRGYVRGATKCQHADNRAASIIRSAARWEGRNSRNPLTALDPYLMSPIQRRGPGLREPPFPGRFSPAPRSGPRLSTVVTRRRLLKRFFRHLTK